jgi:hypothetical protein
MSEIKTYMTDYHFLAHALNKIGWENVLQVIPHKRYDETLYTIIYKGEEIEWGII